MKWISIIAAAIGIATCCVGITLGTLYASPEMTFGVSVPGALVTILWTLIFVWEVKHGD